MKVNQKIGTLFLTMIFFAGCGSNYRRPESIESKMARYQANLKGQNQVPALVVAQVKESTLRSPASLGKKKDKNAIGGKQTNKKLYFLTLYTQYSQMRKFSSGELPPLNSCPSFHSSLVDHKDRFSEYQKKNPNHLGKKYDGLNFSDDKVAQQFPELLLPISRDDIHPTALDIIRSGQSSKTPSQLVQEAFDLHMTKTFDELKELCEYGASDNYYVWENLNTYVKNHNLNPSPKSVQILFRTTIFSNEAIKKSIEYIHARGRGPASALGVNPYMGEVMGRLGVDWTNSYFTGWAEKRN